jgi:hypothetical protein
VYIDGSDAILQRSGMELDQETIEELGFTPPNQMKACVLGGEVVPGQQCAPALGSTPLHRNRLDWARPHVGNAVQFSVSRVAGTVVTPLSVIVPLGTTAATTLVDSEELPHGAPFIYWSRATFEDTSASGISNYAMVTAVNDAPIAAADAYTVNAGATLAVAAPGLLGNDTDADSPSFTAVLTQAPVNGTLVLSQDGSFSYTPAAGFSGEDSFWYAARDVTPLSARNAPVKVTITVNAGLFAFTGFLSPLAATKPDEEVFDAATGPAAGSTYTLQASTKQFHFNWDTSAVPALGCYSVRLFLADGSPARVTIVRFR